MHAARCQPKIIIAMSPSSSSKNGFSKPVFIMLPLDTGLSGSTYSECKLYASLKAMKQCGIAGVMVDVWWGVVEQKPLEYNWEVKLVNFCNGNDDNLASLS